MFFYVVGQAIELLDAIRLRDGNENRFVKAATNQFDLATGYQLPQADKVARMVLLNPQQQRAGIMNGGVDGGMFFQEIQKLEIGIFIAFLKNMLEIARGLVGVNDENEVKRLAGLGHIWHVP
jgi:hypothetical protein